MSSLSEILGQWNKDSKAVVAFHGLQREELPRIPFSSALMNYQSYGGMPRRKVIEFFGPEGSGKTTTALDLVANAQYIFEQERIENQVNAEAQLAAAEKAKKGKSTIQGLKDDLVRYEKPQQVVYLDLENTLDREWAIKLGVDVEALWIITPEHDSAEQILERVLDMARTGEVGLFILDSLPYLVPQQIMEESLEKKMYGGIASTLTDFSKKIAPLLTKYNCTFVGINQIREDLANPYNAYNTPGGKMWKHACSVRLQFAKGAYIDSKGAELTRNAINPAGNLVSCHVAKTKAFRPDRKKVDYTLNYYEGIGVEADLLQVAAEFGVVLKAGAWYTFLEPETGEILQDADGEDVKINGKAAVIEKLKNEPELYDLIMEQVHPLLTVAE